MSETPEQLQAREAEEEARQGAEQAEAIVEEATHSRDGASGLRRRDLLKAMALGATGLAMPWISPVPEVDEALDIHHIQGEIKGDDFTLAHRWRDKGLPFAVSRPSKVSVDALIVGGGIAGLSSAWRLQKAGFQSFVLLERSPHLGGIAHGGQAGARKFPWGAHYVDPPGRENKGLCKLYEDLKVIVGYHPTDGRPVCDPAYIVKPPHRNVVAQGQWQRGLVPWHLATPRDRAQLEQLSDDIDRWSAARDYDGRRAFGFPIDSCSKEPSIRGLDRITMADYLREKKWDSPILWWLVNDRCVDEFSLPVDRISAWAGLQYFASIKPMKKLPPAPGLPYDPRVEQLEYSNRRMSWPEGNAFLARKIVEKIPAEKLRTSQMVVRIEPTDDGVWVTTLDARTHETQTLKTRYVIYAAPKYTAYHCIPSLREGRPEFGKVLYVPWLVASIQCRRPPRFPKPIDLAWEHNRYQSWCQGYINPQHHTEALHQHPPSKDLDAPMVLSFYACLAYQPKLERKELLYEGWDFWSRQIVAELSRMHPGFAPHIERLDIYRWGHAMHGATPGFLFDGPRDAMRKPFGRIHFSQSDTAGLAVFEQVVVRGIETAEEVLRSAAHPFATYL